MSLLRKKPMMKKRTITYFEIDRVTLTESISQTVVLLFIFVFFISSIFIFFFISSIFIFFFISSIFPLQMRKKKIGFEEEDEEEEDRIRRRR